MTGAAASEPRFLVCGEDAIVVEFGDRIDASLNDRVYALAAAIEAAALPAVLELVPTYRSLLVQYDVRAATFGDMSAALRGVMADARPAAGAQPSGRKVFELPVVYGGGDGPDLEDVAEHAGLPAEEVVRIHSGADYRVYMLGFAPGFPYLGGMDERIATPRLATPRVRVPAGSVGIAESQTGVYPMETPGGWRIIGRTPAPLFDPGADPPVAILPGSFIRFVPVSSAQAEEIARRVSEGAYRVPVSERAG